MCRSFRVAPHSLLQRNESRGWKHRAASCGTSVVLDAAWAVVLWLALVAIPSTPWLSLVVRRYIKINTQCLILSGGNRIVLIRPKLPLVNVNILDRYNDVR